ncbi:MAG: hypothetical protein NPIRA02_35700 [Nitrospirales bacterium]|nr:MAG: hypothetical protein NPIRA02_35700 [Nitrospirales bacterium]
MDIFKGDIHYLSPQATQEFDDELNGKEKIDFVLALRKDGTVDVYGRNDGNETKNIVSEMAMTDMAGTKNLYSEFMGDYQKAGESPMPEPDKQARIKKLTEGRVIKTVVPMTYALLEPAIPGHNCGFVYHGGRCVWTP